MDGPDCDGVGFGDGLGVGAGVADIDFDANSVTHDGGLDSSDAEVLGESGGDLSSLDYSVDAPDAGGLTTIDRKRFELLKPLGFGAHVSCHGDVDVLALIQQAVGELSLARVPAVMVGEVYTDKTEDYLVPLSEWSRRVPSGTMPDSYFEGATGKTRVLRTYWQVDRSRWPLCAPQFCWEDKTYIEVVAVTWSYDQTCDHETRILVRVVTMDEHEMLRKPLVANNKAAGALRQRLFDALKMVQPKQAALVFRQWLAQQSHQDGDPVVVPESGDAAELLSILAKSRAANDRTPQMVM